MKSYRKMRLKKNKTKNKKRNKNRLSGGSLSCGKCPKCRANNTVVSANRGQQWCACNNPLCLHTWDY